MPSSWYYYLIRYQCCILFRIFDDLDQNSHILIIFLQEHLQLTFCSIFPGPSQLLKLQQQTRATRILVTKDTPTSLSRNERKVSSADLSSLAGTERPMGAINNSCEQFTSINNLTAYYWLSVLEHMESLQHGTTSDKTKDVQAASSEAVEQTDLSLSVDNLLEMVYSLLWDIQAKRYKLSDSLHYISKATAKLIAHHQIRLASYQ